ncbi:MAG: hypothetical protein AAF252_08225 [Pseudomonadota bacterium]
MFRMIAVFVVLLGLTACAQVVSEQEGTFEFEGQSYRAVTRQFETENGSYARRYIFVGAQRISCSATDDADCRSNIQFSLIGSFSL